MQKFYSMIAVILIVAFIFSCQEKDNPTINTSTIALTGNLQDNLGNPIADTEVIITESASESKKSENKLQSNIIAKDTTDANGNFSFEAVPESLESLSLIIDNTDFLPIPLSEDLIQENGLNIVAERLEECIATLSIDVNDTDGDQLDGALVQLKREGKDQRKGEVKDGKFDFLEVCPGEYELRVSKDGYKTQESIFEIADADTTFTFTLLGQDEEDDKKDSCCGGIINFNITDEDGNAVENAIILLKQEGKTIEDPKTDEDGEASIDELCEGSYTVVIEAEGFERLEYEIEIGCDEEVDSDKTLESEDEKEEGCCEAEAEFIIRDKDNNPIPGAVVKIWEKGKVIVEAETNSDGKAELDSLCEGDFFASVVHPDFEEIEFEISFDCEEKTVVEKTLNTKDDDCCEGTAKFTIKDNAGNPVKNAVVILKKDGKAIADPRTNGDGVVEIDKLCEGSYSVVVEAEGFEREEESEIDIDCNEAYEEEKILEAKEEEEDCCDAEAEFIIRDKDNNTISGAVIKIWNNGKVIAETETNSDGLAELDSLCEGDFHAHVVHPDYEDIEFDLEFDCAEKTIVEKTLEAKEEDCCEAEAQILVQDKDGNALDSATVILKKNGKEVSSFFTSSNGEANFSELCEGNYAIVIERDGYDRIEFEASISCDKKYETIRKLEELEKECCDGVVRITIESDGDPLEGVKILLRKDGKAIEDPRTDSQGRVVIDGLCEGNYSVLATKEGYESIEWELEVDCDKEYETVKEMEEKDCCEGVIELKIQDKDGSNLDSAYVEIKKNGKREGYAATYSDGIAKFENLCDGNYTIIIERSGYETLQYEIELGCNEKYVSTKKLESKDCCEAIMKSKVYDKDTEEVIEGAIVVYKLKGETIADGETNSDGHFSEDGLCLGTYEIIIEKDGYKTLTVEWKIEECDNFQETFRLEKD